MLREYECMIILPAEADEATVSTAVDRIAKTIAPTGGKVDSIDRWGRRRFAYEIAHQHEGYYVMVRFEAEPSVQAELDETLTRGSRVVVTGRLKQRSWENQEGEKRTVVEIEADDLGPSLKWATATVTKTSRSSSASSGGDWGAAVAAPVGASTDNEETPLDAG